MVSENQSFLNEGAIVTPLIGLVLGGEVPRLNHGPICFPIQKHLRGCYGPSKVEYHFFDTSRRIKAHLLLMYCIKNLYIVLNIGPIRMYILMLGTRNAEQMKDVGMYIEEFILVDIWIHCCTSWN